jgi:hypothetical protein
VFTASDIVNNTSGTAGPVGGSTGAGGGIFSLDSSPTVRGGRISSNIAKNAGGGIFHKGSYGASAAAVLVVEDAEIADNRANRFSAAAPTT